MAINDYESSRDRGQPVELYKFVYGTNAGKEYAYTNAEQNIVFDDGTGAVTYLALPLKRDKIKMGGGPKNKEVKIDLPLKAGIAELFRVFPPGRVVTATIRQGHFEDNDFPVVWTGRVLESRRHGNRATLTCESSEAGMQRVGLRRHYQWPCPLVLYSKRCGADKEAAKTTALVSTVVGNAVTLPSGWNGANATTDFVGGLFEWESADGREFRSIIGVNGDTLKLNAAPADLAASDSVDVFLGCPHTLAGCTNVHNNPVNYGGQPFIPLVNPVGKNNHT